MSSLTWSVHLVFDSTVVIWHLRFAGLRGTALSSMCNTCPRHIPKSNFYVFIVEGRVNVWSWGLSDRVKQSGKVISHTAMVAWKTVRGPKNGCWWCVLRL
jgi:hypothetical protein